MRNLLWCLGLLMIPVIASAQDGNVENGKKLFLKYGCYECHGTVGQGAQANPLAPKLAPRPLPLPALIAYVRKPSGSMPPYVSKVVSNAELADIRAYLASIPEPPAVKSISFLISN